MRLIIRTIVLVACVAVGCAVAAGSRISQSGAGGATEEQAFRAAMSSSDPGSRRQALEKFLADFPESRHREEARVQITTGISDPDERIAAIRRFLADYPESEYRDVVFPQMIEVMARTGGHDAALESAVDEYIKGTHDVPPGNIGQSFGTAIEILLRYRALEGKRTDLLRKAVGSVAQGMAPETRSRFLLLLSKILYRYQAYDQAVTITEQALAEAMPDPPGELYYMLGKIQEARGNDDAALDAYMNAGARRGAREIKTALRDAYRKKHGSLDGLHEELDGLMLARPKQFDPGKYARSETDLNGSTVLVELFTGAECGPCIGADMVAGSLGDYFDRETVSVLQYHIHAPGPDPLTNPDTVDRARYYGVRGTPTSFVGGSERVFGGGTAAIVPRLFSTYRTKIDALAKKQPKARFEDLKLVSDGGDIRVSGRAVIAPGVGQDQLRLRIALVEQVVHYTGGNGIHFHHFVVRKMLGPEEGTPFKGNDGVTFSQSVNLKALSGSLKQYLDDYEKDQSGQWPGFQFDEKPSDIDPKQVGVVVFVQDDGTSEVLNSRFVN
jgi:hypothetical protein